MKTLYQCEVCNTLYSTAEEAIACENQPTPTPLFTVGEEVYIKHRYPQRQEQPFGKRTIVKHTVENHLNCYYLNRFIEVGEGLCFVEEGWSWYVNEDRPMLDEDYNTFCFKLGNEVDLRFHPPYNKIMQLTLDLVDED